MRNQGARWAERVRLASSAAAVDSGADSVGPAWAVGRSRRGPDPVQDPHAERRVRVAKPAEPAGHRCQASQPRIAQTPPFEMGRRPGPHRVAARLGRRCAALGRHRHRGAITGRPDVFLADHSQKWLGADASFFAGNRVHFAEAREEGIGCISNCGNDRVTFHFPSVGEANFACGHCRHPSVENQFNSARGKMA